MIFYIALFFAFLYFKIARVHKKEELMRPIMLAQHIIVAIAVTAILYYGVIYIDWYVFIPFSFLFAIMASLIITTIQLGIFVDGKPMFGLSRLYNYLPLLSTFITLLSSSLWVLRSGVI